MGKASLSFLTLLFAVTAPVIAVGQIPASRTQPLTVKKPGNPISSAPSVAVVSPASIAEAKTLYDEGMKLMDADELSLAADRFRQAIKLDPEFADAYSALGRTYFKMRQWQNAIDFLRRAGELNARHREAKEAQQKLLKEKKPEATVQNVPANPTNTSQPTAPVKNASTGTQSSTPQPIASLKNVSTSFQPPLTQPGNSVKNASTRPKPNATQPASPNANAVKPPLPSPSAISPETRKEAGAVQNGNGSASSVPELKATTTTAPLPQVPKKKDSADQAQMAAGEKVAMKVPPGSQVESSLAPIPIKPPDDESALTRIYRVGPNDVLDIRLNESQAPQSTLFTVTPSGFIEYPMLTEPLEVSGLTVDEIAATIESDLTKRALVENAKVMIGVRDYASHTILVSGLVKDSGTKFLRREAIPLYVVVADAQPLPEAARVTVVRNEQNQMYDIELTRAADLNLLVRPGDVITLHPGETQFIYIGGEVKNAGEKTFRRGMTLTQAIISSGGPTPKAKLAQIDRDDGRGFLVGTRVNLKEIQSGKTADPLLKPGDRVMIQR